MSVDSKPRDFSYLNHKNNFHLQLVGNMKRKARPNTAHSMDRGLSSPSRNQIMNDRIVSNFKQLKSIIPVELEHRYRKQSIKTFGKERNLHVSGAAYLMIKSKIGTQHPEKRHLWDSNYGNNFEQQQRGEKKHFRPDKKQQVQKQRPIRKQSEALHKKINDIYSWEGDKENIRESGVKKNKINLFIEGEMLGYEDEAKRSTSCAKKREMAGTYWMALPQDSRVRREDWRKSSIIFG